MNLPVRLVPFSEADFDRLIAWSPMPEFLFQWAGPAFTFPLNRHDLAAYLALTRQDPPTSLAFRGVDVGSGEAIGHVELASIDRRNRSARLARVLVGPESRGRGVGRQLVRAALAVAFDELRLHRVDLFVFDFNRPAIACYERVGFRHEGVLRESRRYGEAYHNACVMSILEHERGLHVREAVIPDELPVVRDLFHEYAAGLGVDLCFQGFAQEVASLPGRYARPAGGLWLAVEGSQALGCIALRPLSPERCEMKRLYVRPASRGRGVGRLLVERALAAAAEAGYRRMCLDTLPSMAAAIELYRSLGFHEIEPYCQNPVPGALFLECEFGGG